MSNTERQRRHRERVRNDPTRATSKLWLEEAERVAAGLWVMTWIARQRGIDTASLTELMDKFQNDAAVLYDQMWPDLPVRDDTDETMGAEPVPTPPGLRAGAVSSSVPVTMDLWGTPTSAVHFTARRSPSTVENPTQKRTARLGVRRWLAADAEPVLPGTICWA